MRVRAPKHHPEGCWKKSVVAAIALVVCIAPALLVLHVGPASLRSSMSAYTPHGPITIDSDATFNATAIAEGWPGDGSLADPYIISGYEFSGTAPTFAIYISDTTAAFVVSDCYIHDGSIAVYLYNAMNGTIENCSVVDCTIGMIMSTSAVTVANNTISGCMYGIMDGASVGGGISGNTVRNSYIGIYIASSDGNVVSGNTLLNSTVGGVFLGDSLGIVLRDNVFVKDGIMITGEFVEFWNTHDIDASNTVNGDPVLYLVDDVGSTISTHYGQIILANCTDTVIESQDLDNTTMGVLMGLCTGVTLQSSVMRDNYYGMWAEYSNNLTVSGVHTVNNSAGGVVIDGSPDTLVSQSTFESDMEGIIMYYSERSFVTHNTVVSDILGITIDSSPYGEVSNNSVQSGTTGITISYMSSYSILDNTISAGEVAIQLDEMEGAVISNNKMVGSGIFVWGSVLSGWNTHDIDTTNTVNSLPVVYLKDLIGSPVQTGAGQIILANCSQMQMTGSYIDSATAAFQLGFTSGCRITGVSASNCLYGVRLYASPGIQVDNAILTADEYGVYVEGSAMCTIATNQISGCNVSAIAILDSPYQTLEFNMMTDCGILISSEAILGWNTHTIDASNFVNGMPVYYAKNANGLVVSSGYGQVIMGNCTSSVVGPQDIVNASAALQLGFCTDITVNNLTASENLAGALLQKSSGCNLKGPWMTHNMYGVVIESSESCTVADGLFYMNDNYAVLVVGSSSYNVVTGNTFMYNNGAGDTYDPNHIQAYDDGYYNSWNGTSGGNCWQDWLAPDGDGDGIVDVPYVLNEFSGAVDYLPLTSPTQLIPELGLLPMLLVIAGTVAVVGLVSRRTRTAP